MGTGFEYWQYIVISHGPPHRTFGIFVAVWSIWDSAKLWQHLKRLNSIIWGGTAYPWSCRGGKGDSDFLAGRRSKKGTKKQKQIISNSNPQNDNSNGNLISHRILINSTSNLYEL